MFLAGNVSMAFNVKGQNTRAHDLASRVLNQGNVFAPPGYSGWGGRLARSAGGNSISLRSSPGQFNLGPFGAAPNYDPTVIDNNDVFGIGSARTLGLFNYNPARNQTSTAFTSNRLARAQKNYYAGLREQGVPQAFEKFTDHEFNVRQIGDQIQERLVDVPTPLLIDALSDDVIGPNGPINPDPNSPTSARPVLSRRNAGTLRSQISNFHDVVAVNDSIINPRVLGLRLTGWDTHRGQNQIPSALANDPNTREFRGIESHFRDLFGGQYGDTPSDTNALHGSFSALWSSLPFESDRERIVLTFAGEFGRQIRDNGDLGTDHGVGNLMLVVSERTNGGIYGEMFPESEIDLYDNPELNTPFIEGRTEIDHLFSTVCDWVSPNSGEQVFPRMRSSYSGEAPIIERAGMFDSLMS